MGLLGTMSLATGRSWAPTSERSPSGFAPLRHLRLVHTQTRPFSRGHPREPLSGPYRLGFRMGQCFPIARAASAPLIPQSLPRVLQIEVTGRDLRQERLVNQFAPDRASVRRTTRPLAMLARWPRLSSLVARRGECLRRARPMDSTGLCWCSTPPADSADTPSLFRLRRSERRPERTCAPSRIRSI